MAKVELWQEPGAVFSDWSTAVHAVYRSKGSKTFSFFTHILFFFFLDVFIFLVVAWNWWKIHRFVVSLYQHKPELCCSHVSENYESIQVHLSRPPVVLAVRR